MKNPRERAAPTTDSARRTPDVRQDAGDETRRASRYELGLAICFEAGAGARVDGVCRNLSLGGMFIETIHPAAFGSSVLVQIQLPGLKAPTAIPCVVRWTDKEGMGVQFGGMGARETHALTELIYGPR